jgi:hypothetical protein
MHSIPEGSKVSRYDTAVQAQKSINMPLPELNAPELPDSCKHLWRLLTTLETVSYGELEAYQRVTGDDLAPWEIDVIMQINLLRRAEPKCPLNMLN